MMQLHQRARRLRAAACAAPMLLAASGAQAARPLATDDPAVNPAASCQLEARVDRAAAGREAVLASACGLGAGFELGVELRRPSPSDAAPRGRGIALKWADPRAAAAGWRFGAALQAAALREPGAGHWRDDARRLTALASRGWLDERLTLYLNLAHEQRPASAGQRATPYALALAFTPGARGLLFAELSGDDRATPTRAVGARYWLLPDVLGLDAVWSRQAGVPGSRVISLGLGWYGVGF